MTMPHLSGPAGSPLMTTPALSRPSGRPFRRPVAPSGPRRPAAMYCRRPRGRVRVPDDIEAVRAGAPGDLEGCPPWGLTLARQHALEVLP